MPRIIYLCPSDNAPTGGVKVIYRHAEMLCELGADAFVLHPFDTSFRCTWFEHNVRFLDDLSLDEATDFVIVPEIWAGVFGPQCEEQRVRYAIFVQNGYIAHPILPAIPVPVMDFAYSRAALVLVISDDTADMMTLNYPDLDPAAILRVRYSVHRRFVTTAETSAAKQRLVTYMPRKMATHASRVVYALSRRLPAGWAIAPIDNVDEATCAALLRASRIFLSFSDFEGLPLPPLEAALAGNLVIGYTGQGAREYWITPNFQEIHQGDVLAFVRAAEQAAVLMDAGESPDLQPGVEALAHHFSIASEVANLAGLLQRIHQCCDRERTDRLGTARLSEAGAEAALCA